ncbi:MAG: rhomboid family intramembrane serine protease [Rhizobiales bacterium]|nr:rhomboid family intramembrane serine protease [Hyphomicrobiales bacterium]MBI3673865.1 rhomboid family intramembrane serine protease [Hyphomicrobiales bacterium]
MSEFGSMRPPVFQSPPVVLALIAVLAAIHGLLQLAGNDWQVWSLYAFAFIPARYGGEPFPAIAGAQVWSFLSYAFLHASWTHLLFNSLWLLIFGTVVARYLGAFRFLLVFAIAAIAGAAATLADHWGDGTIMIGASGGVSGLMAAAMPIIYGGGKFHGFATGDPASTVPLTPGEFLRHRGALIFTGVFLLITLYSGATGFTGNSYMAQGGIAWEDHLGGFAGGLVAFYLLARGRLRA